MIFFRLILPLAITILPVALHAQTLGVSELHGGAGVFAIADAQFAEQPNAVSESPWSSKTATPVALAGFQFYKNDMLVLGMDIGFQGLTVNDRYTVDTTSFPEKVGYSVFSVAPKVQLNWLQTEEQNFILYSGLNVGLSFITEKHDRRTYLDGTFPQITAHLAVVGMRFGKDLAGFFELGAGYKGLINAGVSYRLK